MLTHLVNPVFTGGPAWPNIRQAYVVGRRPGELLLASDGLSDPYDEDEPDTNGLGHEFYATTTDPIDPIAASWLWDVVWQTSNNAARHGGLAELIDDIGLLSMELYDVRIPDPYAGNFINADERVGVLLGLTDAQPPATVAGPLSTIRLINIKLLTLDELAYAAEYGEAGRRELARRFGAQGHMLASSLDRPSVV
ncbi:hypothetical protein KRMM14A1259_42560 [Krasilnikovia sp. MM14-A1259]